MPVELIDRARGGSEAAFRELVEPYRHGLQVHCYRILGSIHSAEDAVQETMLAAWLGLASFEGRSSIRRWLYQIATNRCLKMLRSDRRRPTAEKSMGDPELPSTTRVAEVLWLEPYPDSLLVDLVDASPGPEVRYETREAISLAFITALQLLPPRQRAALILREVLGYRAKEVAEILATSEESVTSALKRARATLEKKLPVRDVGAQPPPPNSPVELEVVARFTTAFESGDLKGLIQLLTEDVLLTMPPLPYLWQGTERAIEVLRVILATHVRRLVARRANGQPAFGLYLRDPHGGVFHAMGLLVITLAGDKISAITRFDNSTSPYFRLPRTLAAQPEADPTALDL